MLDGERVRMTRLKYRISQKALAEMIGQRQSYISRLERGDVTAITVQTLEALADALRVTTDYLLGRDQAVIEGLTDKRGNQLEGHREGILEEEDEKQLVAAVAL